MSIPVALGQLQWIHRKLANRISNTDGSIISCNVSNKMILSGLIAANDGRSGQGNSTSDLEPGSILAGTNKSGCLNNFRTTFVRLCLKKLIVRAPVLDVSRKVSTLATSEPG